MKPAILVTPTWFMAFTDYTGFLESKKKDKSWDKIPDKLFQKIFNNSNSDIECIRTFLMISNQFNLQNISYSALIRQQKNYRDFVLHTLISHALLEIGRAYMDRLNIKQDANDLISAEQYLNGALLCDEYCIPAYPGLAACYRDLNFAKEKITDIQNKFKKAARHYHYDKLNTKQKEYFINPDAMSKISSDIERLAAERMHLEQTKNTV